MQPRHNVNHVIVVLSFIIYFKNHSRQWNITFFFTTTCHQGHLQQEWWYGTLQTSDYLRGINFRELAIFKNFAELIPLIFNFAKIDLFKVENVCWKTKIKRSEGVAIEFILRGLKVSYMGLGCSGSAVGGGWILMKKRIDKLIFRVHFLVLKGYSDLLFITELIGMID